MSSTAAPERRDRYRHFRTIQTRWRDNDVYGHVNNVVYYQYFEAIVVRFLMEEVGPDWLKAPFIPLAVETQCRFRRPLSFPETVEAGLRISRLGGSSVIQTLALFGEGDDQPAATGRFVHVYVERETNRPTPIPAAFRAIYERFT